MTSTRFVLSALVLTGPAGASACAQDASAAKADDSPQFTMDDVEAAPDVWRKAEVENLLVFETSKGEVIAEMLPEAAPAHVAQFRAIASSGMFDGTNFHRVIDDFMAQGGQILELDEDETRPPNLKGEFTFRTTPADMPINPVGPADTASSGLYMGFPVATQANFLAEMMGDARVERWIPHCAGIVSTARTDDPNSASSQFFLMRGQAPHLDKKYTAWGRIVAGYDVVLSIKSGPKPSGTPIVEPDSVKKAYMMSDLPEAEQSDVWVQRSDTPEWSERMAEADQNETDICDVMRVPAVVGE